MGRKQTFISVVFRVIEWPLSGKADIQARDMTKVHEILEILYESMQEDGPKEESPVDMEKVLTGVRITKLRGSDYRFTADFDSQEEEQANDPASELGREFMKDESCGFCRMLGPDCEGEKDKQHWDTNSVVEATFHIQAFPGSGRNRIIGDDGLA